MNNSIQNLTHSAERKMVEKLIETALSKMNKDREESFLKIVDWAETFFEESVSKEQFENIREMIRKQHSVVQRQLVKIAKNIIVTFPG